MKVVQILLLVIFLFVEGYKPNPTIDKPTKIFSKYLNEVFHEIIPDSLHYYILVPQLACKSCAISNLIELENNLNPVQAPRITFITTNKQLLPASLFTFKVLIDENKELDNLNLPIANVTLLETEGKKVNFIKRFDGNDQTPIMSLIRK